MQPHSKKEKPDLNESGEPFITGYYGCKCHPFFSWAQLNREVRKKMKKGDFVKHRCKGKYGLITEKKDAPFYSVTGMGSVHVSELIKL